jgi:hypothetical protein
MGATQDHAIASHKSGGISNPTKPLDHRPYLPERHGESPTRLAAQHGIHRATLRQRLRRLDLQGEKP